MTARHCYMEMPFCVLSAAYDIECAPVLQELELSEAFHTDDLDEFQRSRAAKQVHEIIHALQLTSLRVTNVDFLDYDWHQMLPEHRVGSLAELRCYSQRQQGFGKHGALSMQCNVKSWFIY